MELHQIQSALDRIHGCTFATLDATTVPSPGMKKVQTGVNVALFNSKAGASGYETMVKKRLAMVGIDPDSFSVADLPWGDRVSGPLIENYGRHYLQCVVLSPGETHGYIGGQEINTDEPSIAKYFKEKKTHSQGLPPELAVRIRSYGLDGITRLVIFGEEITS